MGLAKIRIYKHQNVRVGKQREWREGLKNQAKPSHHISSRDKINGWAKNEPLLGDHPGMSAVPNHGMWESSLKRVLPHFGVYKSWTMKMHHLRYHDFRLPRPCLVIPPHNCLTCERFHPNFRKIGKLLIVCVFFSKSLAIFALCDYRPEERLATIRHTHLYSPTSTLKHVAGSKNNSSSPATYLPRVQRAANVDCLGTTRRCPSLLAKLVELSRWTRIYDRYTTDLHVHIYMYIYMCVYTYIYICIHVYM